MALANLPRAVVTFLDALGKRDIPAILARFTGDAVLVDRGVEHSGDAIKTWSEGFLGRGFHHLPDQRGAARRQDGAHSRGQARGQGNARYGNTARLVVYDC